MITNIMIAKSILNLLGSLSTNPTTQTELNGANNFEALIKKSMHNFLKTDGSKKTAQSIKLNQKENSNLSYLEKLRTGLLEKGKSLEKIYLKESDIHTLNLFLTQCGYSKTDAKLCIDKLLENNPDGKIKLSDIFSEIETHLLSSASDSSGKNKSDHPVYLEPSVMPGIESALKDLGLSLKDADNVLNAARSASGGLDLNKLIVQLKTLENRPNKETSEMEEKISAAKFLEKHEKLGLKITPDKETGLVSIDRFIAALEQFENDISGTTRQTKTLQESQNHNMRNIIDADTAEKNNNFRFKENILKAETSADKLPMDVKVSIDKIIERSVTPDEDYKLKLNSPSLSQLKSEVLQGKEKKKSASHIFRDNQLSESAQKTGTHRTDYGNQGIKNTDTARQDVLGKISDIKDVNPEKNIKDVQLKSNDILQEGAPAVKFESLSSALERRSGNSFLPANTMELLGKQISKSVARGDRIINLQLTPPELGSVKLSMEIKDSVLQLKMVAESASAKEVLLANSHDLKNVLASQGIKLDRLDIQVDSNFGSALTDLNEGYGREQKQQQETGGNLFLNDNIKEEISSDVLIKASKDNLLNLTA
ncbi:MAG: flagellar hook-length control protein FliK [Proteobacteria bacterium]|nr:flagellar hook-length control protein FliK [Pseudomonadota bacterium]